MQINACFVFNGKYDDHSLDVEAVINTAIYAKDTIFDSQYLELDRTTTYFLENVDDKQIKKTVNNILNKMDKEEDLFLFYFCGHAFIHFDTMEIYLGVSDIDPNEPNVVGLSLKTIIDIIKTKKVKYYGIIIDSCHAEKAQGSELGVENKMPISETDDKESKGNFIISSTRAHKKERVVEINGIQQVPFSYFFFEIIRNGIENQNKRISFEEIHKNLKEHVPDMPEVEQLGNLFSIRLLDNLKYKASIKKSTDSFSREEDTRLKVLLVKTAIAFPVKFEDFGIPMGLWVLKAFIDQYNADVKIDIFDERLELLKELELTPTRNRAQLNVKEKFSKACAESDVVGVSMCTCEVWPGLEKLQIAKNMNKVTFVGGIFTASNEKYLLETNLIDYVIPSVGALPLRLLLEWLAGKKHSKEPNLGDGKTNDNIAGVATKCNLDEFFIPTTDHLPNMTNDVWVEIIEKYKPYMLNKTDNLYHADVYSMRGCACSCKFCSVQLECGRVPISRNRRRVISDIEFLYDHGFRYFSLKDEDALANGYNKSPKGFKAFLQKVAKPDIKFKIRTRIDRLIDNPEILNELFEFGIDEIQYGIESSSFIILKNIEKGLSENNVENVKSFIKKHADIGITANCSFILGLEGEDKEYYQQLSSFIKELYDYSKDKRCIKPYINFITPHPRDSEFPLNNKWEMITTDLNYFTHKYPVCVVKGSDVGMREKMIEMYEDIISYTDSKIYNPSLKDSNYRYLIAVKIENKNVIKNPKLPKWKG